MARPSLNRAFAVGLLVAVTGVALLLAFTFFKKGGYTDRDSYKVYAYFQDVTGLTWKSRVQIAGIQVGEVDQVTLAGTRARLDLRIRKDIDLRADACLTKRFPSTLLPDALLEATPGTPQGPSLRDLPPDRREITCVNEATSIQKLLDSLQKIASDVQFITRDLTQTVGGTQGSFREIVEHLSAVARNIDRTVSENGDKVASILDNASAFTGELRGIAEQDREHYHTIARNVAEASERLNAVLASLQGIVGSSNEPQMKQSFEGLKNAIYKANDSLDHIQEVTTKIAEGKGVAGKLLADERMGQRVGNAIEGVTDYVDRLMRLQVQLELRSEWLLQQAGAKTYFGVKILPRPDKYYLLEITNDPRGVNTVTNETVVTKSSLGPQVTTQTTRTVNEQKLTFSAEFAKRYGQVTFRVGVIESSGGVGADLHLVDDHLQISVNFYQFTRIIQPTPDFPRAKIWANYYFLNHFYVTSGADDFLNQWYSEQRYPGGPKFDIGRDVFFGAGLYFTDDDIKLLFGAGIGNAAGNAATVTK